MGVRTGTFPGEVMVLTIFLLFSLASLAHCWGDKASADPEWNKDYDEPAFTSEARPGYEARTHSPSTWACTNMTVDTRRTPSPAWTASPSPSLCRARGTRRRCQAARCSGNSLDILEDS